MSAEQSGPASITLPLSDEQISALRAGDRVLLTGTVYTARDAAHKRLVETLDRGEPPPFPLAGQVIYYVGPSPARPGAVIGSAGPTTSTRMDPYTLPLLRAGLKGMIGKGSRGADVREGIRRYHALYFAAVGGAAALIADRIESAELIAYADLGPEAIYRLQVKDFPAVVANDIYGGDLYEQGKLAFRQEDARG